MKYTKTAIKYATNFHDVITMEEATRRMNYWIGHKAYWHGCMRKGGSNALRLAGYNRAVRNAQRAMYMIEIKLGRVAA